MFQKGVATFQVGHNNKNINKRLNIVFFLFDLNYIFIKSNQIIFKYFSKIIVKV